MATASSSTADSSFMLWALSAVIVLLAAHVLLGWIRQAQSVAQERRNWVPVALGACTFGTALSAAVALSLSGEPLPFPIGYQRVMAAGIWLGSMAVLVPVASLLAFWPGLVASVAAGIVMGAVATTVQAGWVTAAGFRPGIVWNFEFLIASWLVCAVGFSAAFALGFPSVERSRQYRYSWRIAASALMALCFAASLALVVMGAGLPTQVGSVYRHELSGTAVSLIGGGILPLALVMMVVDLEVRRRQRRRLKRKKRREAHESRFMRFDVPGPNYPVSYEPATAPVRRLRKPSSPPHSAEVRTQLEPAMAEQGHLHEMQDMRAAQAQHTQRALQAEAALSRSAEAAASPLRRAPGLPVAVAPAVASAGSPAAFGSGTTPGAAVGAGPTPAALASAVGPGLPMPPRASAGAA